MATISTPTGSITGGAQEIMVTAFTGVAVVVLLYWLAKREIVGAAGAVGEVVNTNFNPTKDTNLAYRASSGIVKMLGGDPANTLGTQIYEDVQTTKKLLNPASNENIVQKAGDWIVQTATGKKTETLSGKIGDSIDWFKGLM